MTNNRPFAYNTGSLIAGTTQVGTIAVGQLNIAYNTNYGGVDWWGGPNENVGYVIAHSDPTGGHNGEPGVPAYLGFWQKPGFTEADFLSLANDIPPRIGYTPFVSANAAVIWLNNNGYWTNYGYATPTPTAGPVSTPTPTVTSTHTPTPTPTHSSGPISSPTPTPSVTHTQTPTGTPASTPTPTPTHSTPSGFNVTIVESGSNVVMSASGSLNINDLTFITTTNLGGSGLGVNTATFIMGTNGNFSTYSGFTSTPTSFGTGGGLGSSSASGDIFGVIFQGTPPYELAVPSGYTTGTYISSTQTFNSASFASLGLVEGTYTYTWGSGANADSINVVVGGGGVTPTPTATSVTPTPTPTSGGTGNFNVTVSQQGPNVVWNGSGYFNLAALSYVGSASISAGFAANQAIWAIGPNTTIDQYQATTSIYPTTFGNGGVGVSSTTGSTFGILPGGTGRLLYVPSGYISNSVIGGSATYSGQTISSMGLSGGTYTWTWTTGGNSTSLVMNIVP